MCVTVMGWNDGAGGTRVKKERRRQCVEMRAEERDRGVCRRIGKCNERKEGRESEEERKEVCRRKVSGEKRGEGIGWYSVCGSVFSGLRTGQQ
jgi:hypothetical protein